MKYRIVAFEKVFYDIVVDADSIEEAEKKAYSDINLAFWTEAGIGDFEHSLTEEIEE